MLDETTATVAAQEPVPEIAPAPSCTLTLGEDGELVADGNCARLFQEYEAETHRRLGRGVLEAVAAAAPEPVPTT